MLSAVVRKEFCNSGGTCDCSWTSNNWLGGQRPCLEAAMATFFFFIMSLTVLSTKKRESDTYLYFLRKDVISWAYQGSLTSYTGQFQSGRMIQVIQEVEIIWQANSRDSTEYDGSKARDICSRDISHAATTSPPDISVGSHHFSFRMSAGNNAT